MSGIFWRFFVAIWLTLLSAIAVITVVNSYIRVLPPKGEMREFRERFGMDSARALIGRGDVGGAENFLDTLAFLPPVPVHLRLTAMKETRLVNECQQHTPRRVLAYDPVGRHCYSIEPQDPPLTWMERYAPGILPPLAALITSVISAGMLARYLVRPVVTLRMGLNALAGGNFAVRIGTRFGRRRDEITALGKDFDATATKLEELQEAQRRLFHDVSHELRSPLSRMQAAIGLLKQTPSKFDTIQPRMDREIQRLDGLVEEILTLARLGSTNDRAIERQSVDIIDLLTAIIDDAAFEAEPKGMVIRHRGVDSFISEVNGELIYRAIENVMRNAVKYSPADSVIYVKTTTDAARELAIEVSNAGPYVSPEDVERIFDPFTRLLENETVLGHGLGLAITRRAIESHGGMVTARSNPGGGLIVTIRLPQASQPRD